MSAFAICALAYSALSEGPRSVQPHEYCSFILLGNYNDLERPSNPGGHAKHGP